MQRSVLVLELRPLIEKKAKKNQGQRTDILPSEGKMLKPIDTRQELANMAGVSKNTIEKAEKIIETATPCILSLVIKDKIPMTEAEKASMLDPEIQEEIAPLLEAGARVEKLRILHNTGNNEWYTPSENIWIKI